MKEKNDENSRLYLHTLLLLVLIAVITCAAVAAPVAAKVSTDFKQCANYDPEPFVNHWINGIIQRSNSEYYEGMSIGQRILFHDIPATTGDEHTLVFKVLATKGGIHAYDFLCAYNQSNVDELAIIMNECGPDWQNDKDYPGICEALQADESAFASVPDDPFLSKDTSTQSRIDAFESTYGDRTIKILAYEPITDVSMTLFHGDSKGDAIPNGGDTGDTYIWYTLSWTSSSTDVLIEMAGHLSVSGDYGVYPIAWGEGNGAAFVSGGPYHFKLETLDGVSLGAQDNQIQAGTIMLPLGCLEVTKNVVWSGADDYPIEFSITVTNSTYGYSEVLAFNESGGVQTLHDLLPGIYTLTETDPGEVWNVTPGFVQTISVSGNTECAPAIFTNTLELGCLNITKEVDLSGAVGVVDVPDFAICIMGPSYTSGDCKVFNNSLGLTQCWQDLIPGYYLIYETDPGVNWTVGGDNGTTATVAAGSTCSDAENQYTVIDTYRPGCLNVTKTVNWMGVPPDTGVEFEVCIVGPSYPTPDCHNFSYSGGSYKWDNLIPGDYTISETAMGDLWETEISPAEVAVTPGNDTCQVSTVTNTYQPGCIRVNKTIDLNGAVGDVLLPDFMICVEGPSYPSGECKVFNGSEGYEHDWTPLIPGYYNITEVDPGDLWEVSGEQTNFLVEAADDCGDNEITITNTYQPGCLNVTKNVDWSGAPVNESQTFEVCITGPSYPTTPNCKSVDYDGEELHWGGLIPGWYWVNETTPDAMWLVEEGSNYIEVTPGSEACESVTINNTLLVAGIGDYVWEDQNADGIQNPGIIPYVEGVKVTLYKCEGCICDDSQCQCPPNLEADCTEIANVTTDANGAYNFTNLIPGCYYLEFELPDGYFFSPALVGDDFTIDSDANPTGDPKIGRTNCTYLSPGEYDSTVDAAVYADVSICVWKFHDLDKDGERDAGEELLSWNITLWNGTASGPDTPVSSIWTNTCDIPACFNVTPNKYWWLSEDLSEHPGWVSTNATLLIGDLAIKGSYKLNITDDATVWFGNYENATKCGYKYIDENADHVLSPEENTAVNGIEILLWNAEEDNGDWTPVGSPIASVMTGSDDLEEGQYCFYGLTPGEKYLVTENISGSDWIQSYPYTENPADPNIQDLGCGIYAWKVNLTSGQEETENNFGNYKNATKCGYKLEDTDNDGIGDKPLEGWEIRLYEYSPGYGYLGNTTTAYDGSYCFDDLTPGVVYDVCEVLPANWQQVGPGPTGTGNIIACGYPETGPAGYRFELESDQQEMNNNFTNVKNATKCGMKFVDENGDGRKDSSEPGVGGVEIELWGVDAGAPVGPLAVTTTAADGSYCFEDLLTPGVQYYVTENLTQVEALGWTQTYPNEVYPCGFDRINLTDYGRGWGYNVTLVSNETDSDNDFGNYLNATKAGFKFEDANNNNAYDPGETKLSGWQIRLFGTDGMGKQVDLTDTTDGNGLYSFSVPPGNYFVCEIMDGHPDWTQTYPNDGYDCSQNNNLVTYGPYGYEITLVSDQTDDDNNFGNYQPPRDLYCGLTMGFWKNNVNKYLDGWDKGRQVCDEFFEDVDPADLCVEVGCDCPSKTNETYNDNLCEAWDCIYNEFDSYPDSNEQKAIAQRLAMALTMEYNGTNWVVDYTDFECQTIGDCEVCPEMSYCSETLKDACDANPSWNCNAIAITDLWEYLQELFYGNLEEPDYNTAYQLADCINNYKFGCYESWDYYCSDDGCASCGIEYGEEVEMGLDICDPGTFSGLDSCVRNAEELVNTLNNGGKKVE